MFACAPTAPPRPLQAVGVVHYDVGDIRPLACSSAPRPAMREARTRELRSAFLGERPDQVLRPSAEFRCRRARPASRAAEMPSRGPLASAAVEANDTSLAGLLRGTDRKFVFVGGKGGVGKTSTSAALAVRLADAGHTVLVVSTDPAHSLSDALDQDVSGGEAVPVNEAAGVYAMEVDPEQAIADFKRSLGLGPGQEGEKSRAQSVLDTLGVGDALSAVSLGGLLDDIPPGTDEVVALTKVLQFLEDERFAKFDRVVIDTAPTGHTLRLLAFPDFLDQFMGKILKLRGGIEKAAAAVKAVFAARGQDAPAAADNTVEKIEEFQEQMRELQALFRDPARTRFCVVTVATEVAAAETERLVAALRKERVPCHNLIVNQVVPEDATEAYAARWSKNQSRVLASLDRTFPGLEVIKVPLMDAEVRGLYPLRFLGRYLRGPEPEKRNVEALVQAHGRRYVFVGGKGGVGKTSTSAALAIQMADAGHRTLVVSTDPAHSLSDAFDQDVSGGKPVQLDGDLFALELDVQAALDEFKQLGADAVGGGDGEGTTATLLREVRELLQTAPPGLDEAAALSKIVGFLEDEGGSAFDRVIFDTAPTGHTLRLLAFPDFLDGFLGRILRLREKLAGIGNAVKSVFGKEAPRSEGALERLERFQARMQRLEALFRDSSQCEFLVVSIPTVLAASESARLVKALHGAEVAVRTAVVNQVVEAGESPEAAAEFAHRVAKQHARTLARLQGDPQLAGLELLPVPYFDTEVRGVYGLRSLAAALLPPPAQ